MSSVQTFSTEIMPDEAATYLEAVSGSPSIPLDMTKVGQRIYAAFGVAGQEVGGTVRLKPAAMAELYPNATAKPFRLDYMSVGYSNVKGDPVELLIDGTSIFNETNWGGGVSESTVTKNNLTGTAVVNSTRSSQITMYVYSKRYILVGGVVAIGNPTFTFYFNRYDFSATAGTGVASAQVTAANGFDGDSITYSCTLQNGATFAGWYLNGALYNSNQSFVHTVSGQDLTLEARAIPGGSGTLTAVYNGNTLFTQTLTGTVTVTYNGNAIATLQRGTSKTLSCAGKVCTGNLVIGGKTLNCAGKRMQSDVVINFS